MEALFPKEALEAGLEEGVRQDGRALSHTRRASIEHGVLSSNYGSALARMGGVSALAGIDLEVLSTEYPEKGELVVIAEPEPCQVHVRGKLAKRAQAVAERAQEAILGARCMDMRELADRRVGAGYKATVRIQFLGSDGALFPVALKAALGALANLLLPPLGRDGAGEAARLLTERPQGEMRSVSVHSHPGALAVGMHTLKGGRAEVLDPTEREQRELEAVVEVAVGREGYISGVFLPGAKEEVSEQELATACSAACSLAESSSSSLRQVE